MPSAILLAAGRGERMAPLTAQTPKPLLRAGGKTLIEWQLERLAAAGFDDIVVNHSYLGEQIEAALGDGRRFGVRLRYSPEDRPLETAGGVAQALHLMGSEPVLVVSSDIHTDFQYRCLLPCMEEIAAHPERTCAHFVLVDNPPWHPHGDMALVDGRVREGAPGLTYGNISIFHPVLFRDVRPGARLKLFPWSYGVVRQGRVSGEHFRGEWDNVGTPQQLAELDGRLST